MARPIILDTDTGVDDALALILALRSPEVRVEAVTTVAGNVPVEQCSKNVLYVLYLLQLRNILVAQGAGKPLKRSLVTAQEVHGQDGLGNARPRRKIPGTIQKDAVLHIVALCRKFGRRLIIVALGPLTNIAHALRRDPVALKGIGRLVTMGGAFRVRGNTGPVAEFNYYVDPDAAHLVLNSGIPITVVPLDVTEQVVLTRTEVEYRARRRASKLARAILRFTDQYMQYHNVTEGFVGGYLHDPIAVAAAITPGLLETRRARVVVERVGEWTRGMTLGDFRRTSLRDGAHVDVALKVNREQFLKLFHERVWK